MKFTRAQWYELVFMFFGKTSTTPVGYFHGRKLEEIEMFSTKIFQILNVKI